MTFFFSQTVVNYPSSWTPVHNQILRKIDGERREKAKEKREGGRESVHAHRDKHSKDMTERAEEGSNQTNKTHIAETAWGLGGGQLCPKQGCREAERNNRGADRVQRYSSEREMGTAETEERLHRPVERGTESGRVIKGRGEG